MSHLRLLFGAQTERAFTQTWHPPLARRPRTAREKYSAMEGICSDCREWTTVLESCCGAKVSVEGSFVDPIEAEQEVENEENGGDAA